MYNIVGNNLNHFGTHQSAKEEELLEEIDFVVHKNTSRTKPQDIRKIIIFPIFSEFGSEMLLPLYIIPMLLNNRYQGKYSIVVGWHGRGYLYKHLVDEFWELKEKHQDLREYSRALYHSSKNLTAFTNKLKEHGTVVPQQEIVNLCTFQRLTTCPRMFMNVRCDGNIQVNDNCQKCLRCGKVYAQVGLFYNLKEYKKDVVWVPDPSEEKMKIASQLVPPNSVAIIARNRKCYGRNLTVDFYKRLICLLEDLGYNPIWMGEKSITLSCPYERIFDYSKFERSNDLELTLAVTSKLKFTIQFWTASTRLAGLVDTPFILFESPDQIWSEYDTKSNCYIPSGKGQEGYRITLCSKSNKRKVVAAHYNLVMEDYSKALKDVKKAVLDIEKNDYHPMVGNVGDLNEINSVSYGIARNNKKIGFDL